MERRPVELVRLPDIASEEDGEEKERDVVSVFPKEGRKFKSDVVEELKAAAGNRFVSETQLHEVQESGLSRRDASGDAGKSLAVILAENKQKKDEAFEEQWRVLKQGKNRPLEPDEYEFLDSVFKQEAKRAREEFGKAKDDVEEFKKARAEVQAVTKKKPPAQLPRPRRKSGWTIKPQLKVIPKKRRSTVSDPDRISAVSKKGEAVKSVKE